ncbi:hypothetical protein JL722_13581 [Aureococcus anophagefferens]|nr:hypothetical protein JL722_13581 [Aureococcus anophagefferens]
MVRGRRSRLRYRQTQKSEQRVDVREALTASAQRQNDARRGAAAAGRDGRRLPARVTRTNTLRATESFENPVPFLQEAIDRAPQFDEGRSVVFGVLSTEVADAPAPAEQARRELAAASLTNIDDAERDRRGAVAVVGGAATLAYAASLVANHASFAGRLSVFPLLALSLGYYESKKEGL